jgi:hypothetical protein
MYIYMNYINRDLDKIYFYTAIVNVNDIQHLTLIIRIYAGPDLEMWMVLGPALEDFFSITHVCNQNSK